MNMHSGRCMSREVEAARGFEGDAYSGKTEEAGIDRVVDPDRTVAKS